MAPSTRSDPAIDVALFAPTLIAWQRIHGRQTLPWQQLGDARDAYRVWLAEIMLQQTQVAAVIPYYRRFLGRFADVQALAAAPLDDVMELWSGLGYYSRARNLHAAARSVVADFGGTFPRDVDALQSLPGIGRSTGGAIAAFAFGVKAPILDGNVKRVLARVFLVEGLSTTTAYTKRMWALGEALLPDEEIERYTQGLMDLGATVCTPRNPACLICPFESSCIAHREGREEEVPERAARKRVPLRWTAMLLVTRGRSVFVERRPPVGIWGGLWSLPEMAADTGDAAMADAVARFGAAVSFERTPGFVHGFTHFVLHAEIVRVTLDESVAMCESPLPSTRWISFDALASVGLPAPVRTLLEALA
ncbi:MAG: A/G-specific adenine glycosylase [Burkholderiaceae bacterium]